MSKARYEVFVGADGQHYWHLKASNGEILAQSEAYGTEEHAWEGVQAAEDAAKEAGDAIAGAEQVIAERGRAEHAAGETVPLDDV